MKKSQRYITLFKELMEEDENLSKEVFFDFFAEYTKPTFDNIWNDDSEKSSFWILLINGINDKTEVVLVKELLFWKEFFSRETTSIRCFQSSDNLYFNLCIKKFGITTVPALIFSNTREFEDYVIIERAQLSKMTKPRINISTILNQIQFKLITGEPIKEIKNQFQSGELFSHLKKVFELKKMVGENKIKEVINLLISIDTIKENPVKSNDMVNISARYSSLQSKKLNGTLPNNEYQIELNIISLNLLEIIDYYEIET